ncbi:FMN-binding protein [Geodermatophilus sp. TF02-6]|uniref:FMN-binding protein n=1 Tax=Geodermatophilus sp. TF02-6 TaxID=2250575 RepID=UPI000DEB1C0C|nr:FMN-binding protein [Geodermatophilus sp. TF02-6]RBY78121.1 FMN-binding protein [Geodermatophilus sp. TF02-6]
MRRIVLWLMSTLTALVLLFGYHTSTSSVSAQGGDSSVAAPTGGASSSTSGTSGPSSSGSGTSSGSSSSGSSSSGSSSSATSTTVTGTAASTRYGPVQVQITVSGGQVTDVEVLEYPDDDGRDRQINARALPILVSETLDAQSADIDVVSGATYTSEGYTSSLQSALDQAGL